LNTSSPLRSTFRLRAANGDYRLVSSEGMPRFLSGKRFAGLVGLCFDITAKHGGELAMEASDRQIFSLLRGIRLGAVILDLAGRIVFCNDRLLQMLGLSHSEVEGSNFIEGCIPAASASEMRALYLNRSLWADSPAEFETGLLTRNNGTRTMSWHATVLRDFSGQVRNIALLGEDVTDSRVAERKLALTAKVFDNSRVAMIITDASNSIISVNQAYTEQTGYTEQDVLGKNPRIFKSGRQDEEFYRKMWQSLLECDHWHGDVWNRRKDGSLFAQFVSISVIRNNAGEITNYSGIYNDNTERKKIEEKMDILAHYDVLTNLPNRALLHDRLELAMAGAMRNKNQLALMFLDLDRFKSINDTYGHRVGDLLLKTVATRLRGCLRTVDTVARLGGDEFVVVLTDLKKPEGARVAARKILARLSEPYNLDGIEFSVTPSIGISFYPDDRSDATGLMECADIAMYRVKQSGRGNYQFFNNPAQSA
jgi:diguanylate cyclase (GGDEF)-like protein/PAS domain S-box-containing protein